MADRAGAARHRFTVSASAAALAAALFLAPGAALAQSTNVDPPAGGATEGQPVTDEDGNEIVVTGFRASLESAVNEKRNSDQIVESVTAEDIGKLPDSSIGESIARLPGLTSQRANGRANVIAIRGLGPDFSQTLLNGREQTTTGDNRGVEFDQYPGEIVSQVVVYKSPTAALVGQGLVGTIDIRTIRPLDYGRPVLAIGARGSYADIGRLNAGSKKYGYRVNGTFVDQFNDDTLGIALSAAYVDEPYQVEEFNAWGYADTAAGALIGGSKSFVTSTRLKRLGLMGTVQFEISPQVKMTVDGFYSDFDDDQIRRGIELPLGFGEFGTRFNTANLTARDGTVVSGTFNNVQGVVRNDVFQRQAEQVAIGWNTRYEGEDGWNAFLDLSYSRTDRNELSLESYSGTGYGVAGGATDTIRFVTGERGTVFDPTLDYSDPNLIRLTDPLGWGGSRVQAGYYNNRIVSDDLRQARLEIEREFGADFLNALKLGVNYTDRDKSLTPDESFVQLAGDVQERVIPSQFLLRPTNLDYLGLGPVVSYDPRRLIEAGVYVLNPNAVRDVFSKSFTVSEKLLTMYGQLDLEQQFTGSTLTGNIGVQAIHTDQSSRGFVFAPDGSVASITLGDEYWDVLPSANLSLRFDSGFVIRAAASRQIQRPRLDDLRVSIGYGVDTSVPGGIIRGGGGNPTLRPYRANAFDLNFEQYFGNSGVVALQLFYKDIKSFIYGGRIPFDFAAFPLPDGVTVGTTIGTLDAPINTGGGKLYGAEAAITLPFSNFSSALDGFGVTGGVGYTKSRIRDQNGNVSAIPGYSKWVANGTAFFEKWGFNARGSVRYRSTFLGDFTGFGGTPTRRQALGETIVDAQIGYDFQDGSPLKGLSLYLQGQNLTDERFASVTNVDNPLQVIDYQIYGRRFLAGFTMKF